MLYTFSRAEVLQFSMIGNLGVSQLFLLVFWRRGLLHWFSCPCWGGIAPPLPGGQAQCKWPPDCTMWLCFAPQRLSSPMRGNENCSTPISGPAAEPPILYWALTGKESITLVFPRFCLSSFHPAYDRLFLSQAHDPVLSLQTLQTCGVDPRYSSQGKEGHLAMPLPFAGPLPGEQSLSCAVVPQWLTIYGNIKQKATS